MKTRKQGGFGTRPYVLALALILTIVAHTPEVCMHTRTGCVYGYEALRPVAAGEKGALDERTQWLEENLLRKILPSETVAALRGRDLLAEAGGLRKLIAVLTLHDPDRILSTSASVLLSSFNNSIIDQHSYIWGFSDIQKREVSELSDRQWLVVSAMQRNITRSGRYGHDGHDYKSISLDGGKTYISLIPPREAGRIYWLTFYWQGYDWEKRDYYLRVEYSGTGHKQNGLLARGVSAPSREQAIELFHNFLENGVVPTGKGGSLHGLPSFSLDTVNLSLVMTRLGNTAAHEWAKKKNYGWLYVFGPEFTHDYGMKLALKGHEIPPFVRENVLMGVRDGKLVPVHINMDTSPVWQEDEVHLKVGLSIPTRYVLGIVPCCMVEMTLLVEFSRMAQEKGIEIRWLTENAPLWEIIRDDLDQKRCQVLQPSSRVSLESV